ncbi:MAG: glycosyltransferase family 9 protein [bacterium]
MKNIIILNLTRMGDLIQSTALFKKIKLIYPDSRVTLLMSTEFAGISSFLSDIDEIKFIDIKGLSELLKSNNFKFTSEVLSAVNLMFGGIIAAYYDIAINLSHDEVSVYFLYILNSLKNIGISITREGAIISNDKMIAYMFSAVKNRKVSVLNLVDIYERCLKPDNKIKVNHVNKIYLDTENLKNSNNKPGSMTRCGDILKENGVEAGDIIISFAIGASTSLKKWRYDYFADLAKMLLDSNAKIKIMLLGAGYDAEAGSYIEKNVSDKRLINLTGKTSVADLVFLVKRSKLLITHDTGTMHIGVAVGTKLIVIYTGNVGFLETGPYSEDNILVTPDIGCFPCDFHLKCLNPVCKNLIKPEYIYGMANMILKNEDSTLCRQILSEYKNSGIIPIVSRFDSKNFIDFLPAVKGKLNFKDLKLRILKLTLELFYEGNFWRIDDDEVNVFLDCFETVEYNLIADAKEMLNAADKMLVFCEKGMKEAKYLVHLALNSPFKTGRIDETVSKIKSIDFELKYSSSVYDEFSLLNQIHVINQNSSVSYDIFGLGVDSLKSYSDYKHELKIFKRVVLIFLDGISKKQA